MLGRKIQGQRKERKNAKERNAIRRRIGKKEKEQEKKKTKRKAKKEKERQEEEKESGEERGKRGKERKEEKIKSGVQKIKKEKERREKKQQQNFLENRPVMFQQNAQPTLAPTQTMLTFSTNTNRYLK